MKANEENLNSKTKLIVVFSIIVLFLMTFIGLTYSYFTIQVSGNDSASSIYIQTAELRLVYTDTLVMQGSNVYPGWYKTKTISVQNTGTDTVYYNIIWRDLLNEITGDELVISATCSASSGSCNNISERVIPTYTVEAHNIAVKNNIGIAPGVTHTYTVEVKFKELGSAQDYNQNKTFRGTLNISEGSNPLPTATAPEYFTYISRYENVTYDMNLNTCKSYVTSNMGYDTWGAEEFCSGSVPELLREGLITSDRYSNFALSNVSLSGDGGIALTGYDGLSSTYIINESTCRNYINSWGEQEWTSQIVQAFCAGTGVDPYDGETLNYWVANGWISDDEYSYYGLSDVNVIGRDVVIPSEIDGHAVSAISENAFLDKTLNSVFIPSSVKAIGNGAFYGNPLTSVTINGKEDKYGFVLYGMNIWSWSENITCVADNTSNVANGCITWIPDDDPEQYDITM